MSKNEAKSFQILCFSQTSLNFAMPTNQRSPRSMSGWIQVEHQHYVNSSTSPNNQRPSQASFHILSASSSISKTNSSNTNKEITWQRCRERSTKALSQASPSSPSSARRKSSTLPAWAKIGSSTRDQTRYRLACSGQLLKIYQIRSRYAIWVVSLWRIGDFYDGFIRFIIIK